jgi:hypothetical protein
MKQLIKLTFALLASAALTLSFTACNDGGGGGAKKGPSSSASFAGASISFNPTVNFLAGDAMTYINTEAGSPFPAAAVATNGTYTYVPNASLTTGVLTLTVDGITDPIVLDITNFRRSGTSVTGFTARAGGVNYPVTVTGTITAGTTTGGGGGGGAGETRADDIPSSMRGSYDLTFHKSDTAAIAGVPADGTQTTFVIGVRTLAFNGKTLTDPVFYNGNELEWLFKDGNIWWAVSKALDGGLNEINVQGPYSASRVAFYGQYNDRPPGGAPLEVDGDGKFVPNSSFSAALNSTSETSSSTPYPQTPKITDTTFFSVLSDGSLQMSVGSGGVFSSYTLPFVSANASTVTYQFVEAGTPDKDYTAVIDKDGDNQPTTITVTFIQTNGVRTTTNIYGLIVQE